MLSVIIPIGRDDEEGRRRRALLEELYCISKQSYRDYEVILVEQIHERPMYEDIEVDKYVPIKEFKGLFNLAWGRNVGAREAEGEKHLHLDADLLFGQDYFRKVIDFGKEAFSAWSKCYYLTEQTAQIWLRTKSLDELMRDESFTEMNKVKQEKPDIYKAAGCAYCFDRNFFFNRFGGFNENFFGWGGDDNDATLRFSMLLDNNYHVLPNCNIYHMPHEGRRWALGGVTGGVGEWERTEKDPMRVTEKLLKANLGKREGPTAIKLDVEREKPESALEPIKIPPKQPALEPKEIFPKTKKGIKQTVKKPGRKINILYMISTTQIGGAETALKRLLQNTDKNTYRSEVLVTEEKGPLHSSYSLFSDQLTYLGGADLESYLISKVKEGRYDYLHFFNLFSIYQMLPKLKVACPKLRIVSSIMITPEVFKTGMKKTYEVIRRNEKYLYNIIVDSDRAKELFPNATVIKNGVDTSKFKTAKKDPKLVVWVGRLSREKGAPVMLEIAKAMPDYKFVMIVGTEFRYSIGWASYQEWLDNAIKNKPSNVKIKIGLSEDKVAHWLSKASYFLQTSISESLPISIIEAMASGCAVLSTNVGDIPKIITHGKNGFIIRHTDIAKGHKIKDKAWLKDGVEIPRTARTLLQYHVSPKSKRLDEEIERYVVKTIPKINVAKIGKRARESVKHLTIDNQVKRYEFIYGNIGSHQGQTRIAFVWAYPDLAPKFWEQKVDSMQNAISALSNEYCVILYAPKPKEEDREFSIINGCNMVFYPFDDNKSLIPLMKEFKPHLICLNSLHFPVNEGVVKAFPDTYKTIYEYGGELNYPLLEEIDVLFVQQKFRIEEAVKQGKIPRSKVVLNPHCVNTDIFKPTKTKKKYNAVMVADFRKNIKRQDILITAWKNVPGKLLLVARLNQQSQYGDYERHCRQIIQRLGLENRVFIQDFVPNEQLPAILNQCKIGIMTSKREGGSRAMLEVMSCGLPMIVLDDSKGCIEMIRPGIDGLVSSQNMLGDTINSLLENPKNLEKMGKAATTRIKKEYSYDRQLSVFKKIIEKARPEISFLTTSYHRGAYIEDCLMAVEKQRLSGLKINHIVVDAGSTDGTLKTLKKHENKIDCYIKKGMSQVSSLNFMMDVVNAKFPNTDYIGWINADDWYEDNWLIESLNHMGKFDVTSSQYFARFSPKVEKGVSDPGGQYPNEVVITDFLIGNRVAQNTVLIKKSSFDALRSKTGFYFNPDFEYTMDYELWVRFLRNGFRIKRIMKPLSNLRIHDLQMSTVEKPKVVEDSLKVQKLLREWGIKK